MKKVLTIFAILLLNSAAIFSQIAINADGSPPDPSAGLDVSFTDRGFLLPRMTFEQRNAIPNPVQGLIVYCLDCGPDAAGALSIFHAGIWRNINLDCYTPVSPGAGTQVPAVNQIEWNWTAVPIALGYKYNTVNDFNTATDLGTSTSFTETGLDCWTDYTRYFWAYNECGPSPVLTLTASTLMVPFSPAPSSGGGSNQTDTSIVWFWAPVNGASGYRWNDVDDFYSAFDASTLNLYYETGLTCQTSYTRYVWAYGDCGYSASTAITSTTASDPPAAPVAGTHIPDITEIVWNWNSVSGASGYKWHTSNDYANAQDLGTLTSKTETGLTCNTPYSRYVWAYSDCGVSTATTLTQSTDPDPPDAPLAGTHVPSENQIIWNWGAVTGATGYKWHTSDDYANATDMGTAITFTESGLDCNTPYTRYVWAYGVCGASTATSLTATTELDPPDAPVAGTHVPTPVQIEWNWNVVNGATGYKWHTSNDYANATDLGNVIKFTETGLSCNTPYTRYVWAYSNCGVSSATALSQTTSLNPPATPLAGTHVPSANQIIWNWGLSSGASGYKWHTSNDYQNAEDLGNVRTKTETGLDCNTPYTRYVWAYSNCGVSGPVTLNETTSLDPPEPPVPGVHVPAITQIEWKWTTVSGASGYKWHTSNDYANATDMGIATSNIETGLTCNSSYVRYVWAYGDCGVSFPAALAASTLEDPPAAPAEGTHIATITQIEWKWATVTGASGYKWHTSDDYTNATDLGNATLNVETGLTCNTEYVRYVWAYGTCGVSTAGTLSQSTLEDPPAAPTAATHVATNSQITWNWNTVTAAAGYKWHTSDDYANATDLGTNTSTIESGLACGTVYTRYVWSYNNCGVSTAGTLSQTTTIDPPAAPVAGTHTPSADQVVWNWNTVPGATGYKWHTADNYSGATDVGANTSIVESGLDCNTPYTRYVWAYNACNNSTSTILTQTTSMDPPPAPAPGAHVYNLTQIEWKWTTVAEADGYKWHTSDDYANATDLQTATSNIETGLTCNTSYTRYVWAYNNCGVSASVALTGSTLTNPPAPPTAGTHTLSASQIVWNWNTVTGATGYKWNTTNNYGSAQEMGTGTSKTETGLSCNTGYTRYVWAYGACGVSSAALLSATTTNDPPNAPVAGSHNATSTQITWAWNPVSGATGYRWSLTNDFSTATNMGTNLTRTETGLTCNTAYTSYVWAYNSCGNSTSTTLSQSTTADPPATPTAGTHVALLTQITWNWNTVTGAVGYKWSTTNNFSTANEMGTSTSFAETGLTCGTSYTRYVWAYNGCGQSSPVTLTKSTLACWTCGQPLTVAHTAGDVAPVNKTTTYGTVSNVPGEPTKCWITSNLGSDHQATSVNDATEASAGWYWQFNRMQGFKHDGTVRTPSTTWITYIDEYNDWNPANDPCVLLLGDGWRLPTKMEWINVDGTTGGNWGTSAGPWNSVLKMHTAGRLYYTTGALSHRGFSGNYWSSTTATSIRAFMLNFNSGISEVNSYDKTWGYSARCIRD